SLATGAGWIVPRKYLDKVGDDGFKKAPVGAGPHRFVSFPPGLERVLEAHEQYWRKVPAVKRLVLKAVPDETTRLAMLKRGEADIVYLLQSALAEEAQRTPGLTLKPTPIVSTHWLLCLDQWDRKAPWADRRVRLAANHAIDRQAMNQAITLGFSRVSWSIIPQSFDFFWQPPPYPYDPARARQLLAEAGYPNGFDAGDLWCDAATDTMSEAATNYLQAVGIRVRVRPLERAAFFKGYQEKKLKNLLYSLSGAFGNAAIRLENFVASGGPYVYGSYPDIDGLFRGQAGELHRKRREAALHRIQQLVHDKVMYAPIWELGFIHAQGPRVAESGLGLITGWSFSAPYGDLKLKRRERAAAPWSGPRALAAVDRLVAAIEAVSTATGWLAGWLIVPMTVAVVYEVVARYALHAPTQWSYEAHCTT